MLRWTCKKALATLLVILLVVGTIFLTYRLIIGRNDHISLSSVEEELIERTISSQAHVERQSKEIVRSIYNPVVTHSATSMCIVLRHNIYDLSSTYCYELRGSNWMLVSERASTY